MSRFLDLTGNVFGRLTVIKYYGKDKWGKSRWTCLCDCGNQKIVQEGHLKDGHTRSCGCLQKETVIKRSTIHNHSKRNKESRTYISWKNMNHRCNNPNRPDYKYYGGRIPPITVCKRWSNKNPKGFENFLEDIGEISENKEIDRINNDGNYDLSNCKLSTRKDQMRNTRNSIYVIFNNENRLLIELSEEYNIPYKILWQRINRDKMSIKKALMTPVRKWKRQ